MPRRYTTAELNSYELRPVGDEATGQRSSPPAATFSATATGMFPVHQDVVDLLTALGVQAGSE